MPWWPVEGRHPDRLERWAAYLLPPLAGMGPDFVAVGGDASSNLRVLSRDEFDVIASITTRYRRTRAAQESRRRQVSHLLCLRFA